MADWLLILIIVLSSLLGLFLIWFFINGIIFFNVSFRRRKDDAHFAENEDPRAKKEEDRVWYFSQNIEELNLKSYDHLNLKGYLLNQKSNKLAILIHGYHGRYYSVVKQAHIFFDNGYDVLSINNRCHDASEGRYFSMGKIEAKDVDAWIKLMLQRNPNYQIVIYGISMGGHIAMLSASSKSVNQNVKCVIEDCCYNSLKEQLIYILKMKPFRMPRLIVGAAEIYTRIFYHFSYSNTLKKALKNLKIPALLIHGGKDNYVPTFNIDLNYDSIPENIYKEKHVFEDSNHTRSVVDNKEKYREIIDNFVNKFVK